MRLQEYDNVLFRNLSCSVIPAKAGIQNAYNWTPAFAGVTVSARHTSSYS